ncbi:hypothetical protein LXL04_019849 [Taraxacum kok-saghyz]
MSYPNSSPISTYCFKIFSTPVIFAGTGFFKILTDPCDQDPAVLTLAGSESARVEPLDPNSGPAAPDGCFASAFSYCCTKTGATPGSKSSRSLLKNGSSCSDSKSERGGISLTPWSTNSDFTKHTLAQIHGTTDKALLTSLPCKVTTAGGWTILTSRAFDPPSLRTRAYEPELG